MKPIQALALTALLAATVHSASAHDITCGKVVVAHPYAPPTLGSGKVGAVYFKGLTNRDADADRLLGARTTASSGVEIHEMAMAGDVMKMRAVPGLALPPGTTVVLKPGQTQGHHLMLTGLTQPLKVGEKFPVTLTFQRAGECPVEVWVEAPKVDKAEKPEKADAHHHH